MFYKKYSFLRYSEQRERKKEAVQSNPTSEVALEDIVSKAIQIPGVKVDRQKFLIETFSKEKVDINHLIEFGLIKAGHSGKTLAMMANKFILMRTDFFSAASSAMGIPGGIAMGAIIPADALQFFGMSLRLASKRIVKDF